ncbi:phage tail terminator protein [Cytobacillus horneckiae]|uniref:Capsid protein n=1 Tax=Cytobacillus horneckiae TaxID=549687 RepID=A0A2N0ZMX0_9BACI|nr:minor capsid protein [Cytobacillus horneckiae]PKG30854.1 capsid protein [Cytobacillus horneckiae]
MDFIERLTDRINQIPNLPLTCKKGYIGAEESFVVYPLPGSQVIRKFMDGVSDQQLNYEIAMKSKSQAKIHQSLWLVQDELEKLDELNSNNNSFEFQELLITNKPFINQLDDQGWFVFLLDIQATVTVFNTKEE